MTTVLKKIFFIALNWLLTTSVTAKTRLSWHLIENFVTVLPWQAKIQTSQQQQQPIQYAHARDLIMGCARYYQYQPIPILENSTIQTLTSHQSNLMKAVLNQCRKLELPSHKMFLQTTAVSSPTRHRLCSAAIAECRQSFRRADTPCHRNIGCNGQHHTHLMQPNNDIAHTDLHPHWLVVSCMSHKRRSAQSSPLCSPVLTPASAAAASTSCASAGSREARLVYAAVTYAIVTTPLLHM